MKKSLIKPELDIGGNDKQNTLASELTDQDEELIQSTGVREASLSSQNKEAQSTQGMAKVWK